MEILLANKVLRGNANAQIALLQLTRANTQTQNCKRAIFSDIDK